MPRGASGPVDVIARADVCVPVRRRHPSQRIAPPDSGLPPIATHSSEIQYLFDQPNTPVPATLDATQQQLANTMQNAWATFAADGNPSTNAVPWPSFNTASQVLSLASPTQIESTFADQHHCDFWAAG